MTISPKLQKAIALVQEVYGAEKRSNGDLASSHPIQVMELLYHLHFSEEVLIAAVLHDICEDGFRTNPEICALFGDRVGFIINALSKTKKYQKKTSSSLANSYTIRFLLSYNRFLKGVEAYPETMAIKMADQIHNLSSLQIFSAEKQQRKLREIEDFFLPVYRAKIAQLSSPEKTKYAILLKNIEEIFQEKRQILEKETQKTPQV